jgi:Protein of unknown function (DUF402)
MRFDTGQTIVRRGIHPDRGVAWCTAGRVISDDERGLLMWVGRGSHMVRPANTLTSWNVGSGALFRTPPGAAHTILWFFGEDKVFTGWYINLEEPASRWFGGLDVRDQALDVLVAPDRTWTWKDEDEFEEQTGHPFFWDEARAKEIRAEGERLIALAEAGAFPFDGTWCDFRPETGWPPSELPWWWDRVPRG